MAIVASLFVPRRRLVPHHFKSIAVLDSKKESTSNGSTIYTTYTTVHDMNSVADHTLYTSAAEILKITWFYVGVIIGSLIIAFFLWFPLFASFHFFMSGDAQEPKLRLAILVALSCGLLIELFLARFGVSFALGELKEALVKRERGDHRRWRIVDTDVWGNFLASLK